MSKVSRAGLCSKFKIMLNCQKYLFTHLVILKIVSVLFTNWMHVPLSILTYGCCYRLPLAVVRWGNSWSAIQLPSRLQWFVWYWVSLADYLIKKKITFTIVWVFFIIIFFNFFPSWSFWQLLFDLYTVRLAYS